MDPGSVVTYGPLGSAPVGTPRQTPEGKATAARPVALPGAPGCSAAPPRDNVELAKQSHGGAVVTPQQILAVRLLMTGTGVIEPARQVGVCRHTIRRWIRTPVFQAEARRQAAALGAQRKNPPRL